ncbi:thiol:disulfide interchange protein precursor [Thalassovita gelatinovora]|uniref:Thiol:disulfide interchange protein n=2 Tax=Thalassovita gelatinovora TaxID=53501 RepID=A0A0P1FTZ1_THAGE|nr:cytochrome c biogenesis CcdA family protein [Thalassovita gelatinovora]QIZ82546.1 cytochrome c biogenesis protein CcdA [Thalassovita gelatinovora]CUH63454.1 thiol:disulfide interchange protein precursor [Thalassovita gelatinovora]SEQ67225.1 Cytochrome C biogenesis protein transmembrane region [Thalassovita gelatinovora]
MELLFGYLAGLLTLINPCVLPVLPIVLTGALQAHRLGPVALAAGMSLSFVTLGLLVSAFGFALGLNEQMLAQAGAVLMLGFGVILLLPRVGMVFSTATTGFSSRASARLDGLDQDHLGGQFLAGLLLGAVWSPCIGPTLGGAIALAAQGSNLGWAAAIMISFALGVSSIILVLGYGARGMLNRHKPVMRALAERARPLMGAVFIIVGFAILFQLHHLIEAWAVEALPIWLQDLSVRF